MQKVIILVGLPASGKSTFVEALKNATVENDVHGDAWRVISWDRQRHFDIDGNEIAGYKFNSKTEQKIREDSIVHCNNYLEWGYNVVIDNTNLLEPSRQLWKNIAQQYGAEVEIEEFNTSLDECIRRNELRTGWRKVPRPVIERMALMSGRVDWPADKKVVIVDMDGTLADISWRKPHASWLIPSDPVRHGVATTVYNLYHSKYQKAYVCIVSGRQLDAAGQLTIDWLAKHDIPYDRIFMRNRGDYRDDTIVKKEILDKIGPERVSFAIDDRPKVIRMWRENGIKTYDVGDGHEF